MMMMVLVTVAVISPLTWAGDGKPPAPVEPTAAPPGPSPPAPDGKDAVADALFAEGMALFDKGQYAQACERFQRSLDARRGTGTLYQLGRCHSQLGRYASAQAFFEQAAAQARAAGQSDREQVATSRARELDAKVSKLVIEVPAASRVAGLVIERDQKTVATGSWGRAVPLDAGTYKITARVDGGKSWQRTVVLSAAGEVRVTIPNLRQPGPPDGLRLERRSPALFWTGIGLTGAGGIALAIGAVGYSICTESHCRDDEQNGYIASAVIGLALAGGGVPLFLVFGRKVPAEPKPAAAKLEASLGPTSATLRLRF